MSETIMENKPGKAGGGRVGLSSKQSWQCGDLKKARLMGLDMREPGCEASKTVPILQMRNLKFRVGKRLAQVTQWARV